MWERIDAGLRQAFRAHPDVQRQLPAVTQRVVAGELPASTAARVLLALSGALASSKAMKDGAGVDLAPPKASHDAATQKI